MLLRPVITRDHIIISLVHIHTVTSYYTCGVLCVYSIKINTYSTYSRLMVFSDILAFISPLDIRVFVVFLIRSNRLQKILLELNGRLDILTIARAVYACYLFYIARLKPTSP